MAVYPDDRQAIATILGPKKRIPTVTVARLGRWVMLFSAYQYTLVCKMSEENYADALSRLPVKAKGDPEVNDCARSFYLGQVDQCPVQTKTLHRAGLNDELYNQSLKLTIAGWPYKITKSLEVHSKKKVELTVENECLWWG